MAKIDPIAEAYPEEIPEARLEPKPTVAPTGDNLTPVTEAKDKTRAEMIENMTADMVAEGKDLTVRGMPELPALKARLGFNVTKAERGAAFDAVMNEMKLDKKTAAPADWADPADFPVALPRMLWHPEKDAAMARTPGHYNALKAQGYFDELDDAASNNAERRRIIWERERDQMHKQDGTT